MNETKIAKIFFSNSALTFITNDDPKPAPIKIPALNCINLSLDNDPFFQCAYAAEEEVTIMHARADPIESGIAKFSDSPSLVKI